MGRDVPLMGTVLSRCHAVPTQWQREGVSTGIASKMAGHSDLATTLRHYTIADKELVKEVTAKMNSAQAFYLKPEIVSDLVN